MKDVRVGKVIKGLSNEISRYVSKKITDTDGNFTMIQFDFIAYIGRESLHGPVYQRDIEASFNIRRSTATGILQRLEKSGFVSRQASPKDGRLKQIYLTPAGEALFQSKIKQLKEMDQLLIRDIPEEELTVFLRVIDQIHLNLGKDSTIQVKERNK